MLNAIDKAVELQLPSIKVRGDSVRAGDCEYDRLSVLRAQLTFNVVCSNRSTLS